ncbi:MAG: hypothetical protein ACKOJF_12685, partial [Planctomycetaceae bacterium]
MTLTAGATGAEGPLAGTFTVGRAVAWSSAAETSPFETVSAGTFVAGTSAAGGPAAGTWSSKT